MFHHLSPLSLLESSKGTHSNVTFSWPGITCSFVFSGLHRKQRTTQKTKQVAQLNNAGMKKSGTSIFSTLSAAQSFSSDPVGQKNTSVPAALLLILSQELQEVLRGEFAALLLIEGRELPIQVQGALGVFEDRPGKRKGWTFEQHSHLLMETSQPAR